MPKHQVAESKLQNLSNFLAKRQDSLRAVLPKHLTPERMTKVAMMAVSQNPTLLTCNVPSLYLAILQASKLGLEIGMDAHLVPFKQSVVMIPDYKGLAGLAVRTGLVSNVDARVVYENEPFKIEYGLEPQLIHKPVLKGERGQLVGVYAIATMKDGTKKVEFLNREDVEKVKKSSRASSKGPWVDWEEEMWKKTAVKRLCKLLPKSVEMARALAIEDKAESGRAPTVGMEGEEVLVDVEAVEIPPPPQEEKTKTEAVVDKVKKKRGKKAAKSGGEEPPEPAGDGQNGVASTFRVEIRGKTAPHHDALNTSGFEWRVGAEEEGGNRWQRAGTTMKAAKLLIETAQTFLNPETDAIQVVDEQTGEIVWPKDE